MSWQAYVDSSLVGTGNIDKGLICDINDKTVWAASPGFSIPSAELQVVLNSFSDTSADKKVYAEGIKINSEKYTVIQSTDDLLLAKKGKEGIVFTKTKLALLVGHHPETVTSQAANSTVVALADYLKGVGY